MIDIHNHILPMVDDGSSSVEMSLEMVDKAYRHGTRSMILTPHLAYAYGFENDHEEIIDLFEEFQEIVENVGIPMNLYLGCEFLFTSRDSFERHKDAITRLNNTNYMLMEFYFDVDEETMVDAVDCVKEEGWIPIIAHPERFEAIQTNISLARRLVKHGAYLQMNKGSILGEHGRASLEAVMELLDRGLITFVGSDAHHPKYRDSNMERAFERCMEEFDEDYIYDIFYINATKYLKIVDEEDGEE